ncbi:MAG: tetratricopeptide repeat protein [Candidatus Hydrogenedentes bacterium]|nr:tetratricopeptide repeat protein [Candidatus Hydrogenedentota bacterium]
MSKALDRAIGDVELAFRLLEFSIRTLNYFELGAVDLDLFGQDTTIKLDEENLTFNDGHFSSDEMAKLTAKTAVGASFGISAIVLDDMFEATDRDRDPTSEDEFYLLWTLIYSVRNAFAHGPANPMWVVKNKYQRKIELSIAGRKTAIDLAGREFAHDKVSAKSMALMIIGQSQFELGNMAQGVASLREAIETVPENSRAKFALGIRLDEMGQTDEGLSWIEASVRAAPLANPRLIRLATLYRRLERPEDARRSFEQAVANNPYEVPAVLGLTELDIEEGTEKSLAGAERRLIDLLAWMPENADAWADLGVVESTLGRPEQAIEAYKRALQEDASHATAALNLALLYQNSGDPIRAGEYLTIAARGRLESFEQLVALHDALVGHGRLEETLTLWNGFMHENPDSSDGRLFATWATVLTGDTADVGVARLHADLDSPNPMAFAILAYAALLEGRAESAVEHVERFCTGAGRTMETHRRLLLALELFHERQPDSPWTYGLTARLLLANGQNQAAEMAIDFCRQKCKAEACEQYADRLTSLLTPPNN